LAPYLFDVTQQFVDRCARRTHTPTNIFNPHSLSDVALRAAARRRQGYLRDHRQRFGHGCANHLLRYVEDLVQDLTTWPPVANDLDVARIRARQAGLIPPRQEPV
jgi:hypothetical protein